MAPARIAIGLLAVLGGLALFWLGEDSDWLTWVGVGIVLVGLTLGFWLGPEALPLAAVALAAGFAGVGVASFADSESSTKPASQGGTRPPTAPTTSPTTAPTTTAQTRTTPTTGRTQTSTGPTPPAQTGTTPRPPEPEPHRQLELPRTL